MPPCHWEVKARGMWPKQKSFQTATTTGLDQRLTLYEDPSVLSTQEGLHIYLQRIWHKPFVSHCHMCLVWPCFSPLVKAIIPRWESNCGMPGVDILETLVGTAVRADFHFFRQAGGRTGCQMKSKSSSFMSLHLHNNVWFAMAFLRDTPGIHLPSRARDSEEGLCSGT